MRITFKILLLLFLPNLVQAQYSLQLTGGVVTLSNGACIIVDQPDQLGIQRTSGYIQSELETNRVIWTMNNSTGSFTIPFGVGADYIPFTFQVTAAGSVTGRLVASTYRTPSTNTPFPTGVVNLGSIFGGTDLTVADRFWVLNKENWATEPTVSMTFSYADPTEIQAPNTIVEANLKAQYWNGTNWNTTPLTGGLLGNDVPASNWVTGVVPTAGNVFRQWIVVDNTLPLPVELLSFTGDCMGEGALLKWATASETNNDYFTIEKSTDLTDWIKLTTVAGAGSSTTVQTYTVLDPSPGKVTYYRLTQTDYDGNTQQYEPIVVKCGEEGNPEGYLNIIYDQEDEVTITFNSELDGVGYTALYDLRGRLIGSLSSRYSQGANEIRLKTGRLSTGLYLLLFEDSRNTITKKFFIH